MFHEEPHLPPPPPPTPVSFMPLPFSTFRWRAHPWNGNPYGSVKWQPDCQQERFLAGAEEQGVKRPESTYFMPTAADTPIRAFRSWYNSRGGSGPQWAKVSEAGANLALWPYGM